jgi:chemotaxis protein MotB
MKATHAPIIVVRRAKKHHGFHGGAWKVAYADFVTAMMAFFLVMWLSAQDSRVRKAIAGYFQQPGVLPAEHSNSILATGNGGVDPAGMPVIHQDSKPQPSEQQIKAERDALSAAAQHIKDKLIEIPSLSSLRDQIEFLVTSEGLRIELIEKNGSSFFERGKSVLRGESVEILGIIAQEIGKLSNDLAIEGHTDRAAYPAGAKYGNWDLSSDRANAARRVMEVSGLRAGQVRNVTGFADTDLRVAADPLDPRNRRVSILVKSQATAATDAGAPKEPAAAPKEPGGAPKDAGK